MRTLTRARWSAERALRSMPAIVGLVGAVYILAWAARNGPIMHSDSYRYFEAATLIVDGKALVSREFALLYFPPFYPLLLGAMVVFGVSLMRAAVLLNAAIFGLNIHLAGTTLRRATGSAGAGAIVALVLLASARFRLDHVEALSDPLFTLLCQTSVLALIAYERAFNASSLIGAARTGSENGTGGRPVRRAAATRAARRWMVVATVAAGLSAFTRLVGYVTMIAVGLALCRLVRLKFPRRQRWRELVWIAALTGISALPIAAWHARNLVVHGVARGSELGGNELTAAESVINLVAHTGRYWSLSTSPSPAHGFVALGLLGVAMAGMRRGGPGGRYLSSSWIFAAIYSVGLIASTSALNALWRSEYAQPLFVVLNSLVVAAVVAWRTRLYSRAADGRR